MCYYVQSRKCPSQFLKLLGIFGREDDCPVFSASFMRPGVEYVYEYDSHVLTGIPNLKQQYSGIKIKCDVRAQVLPDMSVIVQVKWCLIV